MYLARHIITYLVLALCAGLPTGPADGCAQEEQRILRLEPCVVPGTQEEARCGTLSLEKARDAYGVVVDPETFAVDEAATRQLREA